MIFDGTTTRIPERLLLAHQEGKVVFFCGAGISCSAGIPLFDKLVLKSASAVGASLTKEERRLLRRGGCDTVYQNIERRIGAANRFRLRQATASLLNPNKQDDAVLSYHFALLQLSVVRDGERLHLVTTNYDGLFDEAANRLKTSHRLNNKITSYAAPLLPTPKESKWDGMVYLHGKLDGTNSKDNLNSLVLSSGDFGVAYLTERWASRFVTELFRTYTVCFVGYSANDAIVRYIIDAFTADSFAGENERKIYAFDGYKKGEREILEEIWKMKGVEVIPFRKNNEDDYSELQRTLTAWSDYYSLGINGPSRVILDDAVNTPSTLNPEDKARIERVLWAFKSPNGFAARQFCDLTPPASLEWFDVLRDAFIKEMRRYRADVADGKKVSPPMALIPIINCAGLNDSSRYILEWLTKFLNSPLLLMKISTLPRPLSPVLIDFFEKKVLGAKGSKMPVELRNVWLLWLESERKAIPSFLELNEGSQSHVLLRYSDSSGVKKMATDLLEPKLSLTPRTLYDSRRPNDEISLRDAVSWDYYVGVKRLPDKTLKVLPASLVYPIEDALNKLCNMRREMGDEQDESDYDSLSLQDVSGQIDEDNSHYPDWAKLVVMLRYAWLRLLEENHDEATRIAQTWFSSPHPILKRMALFAATQTDPPDPDKVVEWLIDRPQRLFGNTYCREILNLLSVRGKSLSRESIESLDVALSKPLAGMLQKRCECRRVLLLDRLVDAGVKLPDDGQRAYDDWMRQRPQWQRRPKKYDGLVSWISSEPDYLWENATSPLPPPMPHDDSAIIDWLHEHYERRTDGDRWNDNNDEWMALCKDDIVRAYGILRDAVGRNFSLKISWRTLLNEASKNGQALNLWDSFQSGKNDLACIPDEVIDQDLFSVAKWFRALSEQGVDVNHYLGLAKMLFERRYDGTSPEAFKIIMESVLRRWYETEPKEDGGIQSPFREYFDWIVKGDGFALQSARKEFLTQLSNLTLVDKDWVFDNVVPILSWKSSDALENWKSTLKMTWRNADLMEHIKTDFIATASHFNELGDRRRWYTQIVLLMAISTNKGYGSAAYRQILRNLPDEGRLQIAHDIQERLHNAGDKIDVCWTNEIKPFVKMWPAEQKFMAPEIAGLLFAGMAYCNTSFRDATQTLLRIYGGYVELQDVAARLSHPPRKTMSRCKSFPNEVLDILSRVDICKKDYATAFWIEKCLFDMKDILKSNGTEKYEADARYLRLMTYVQKCGARS